MFIVFLVNTNLNPTNPVIRATSEVSRVVIPPTTNLLRLLLKHTIHPAKVNLTTSPTRNCWVRTKVLAWYHYTIRVKIMTASTTSFAVSHVWFLVLGESCKSNNNSLNHSFFVRTYSSNDSLLTPLHGFPTKTVFVVFIAKTVFITPSKLLAAFKTTLIHLLLPPQIHLLLPH